MEENGESFKHRMEVDALIQRHSVDKVTSKIRTKKDAMERYSHIQNVGT